MGALTGDQSANVSGTKYIDSCCIVDFRPNDDWKGEYGFDWFRRGDVTENINGAIEASKYTEIVGKYEPEDPDHIDTGELKHKIGNNDYVHKLAYDEYTAVRVIGTINRVYLVPYISLYYMSLNKWEEGGKRLLPNAMLYQKEGIYYQHDFCKSEVTIKVLIDAKNINKIEFKCDNSLSVKPDILTNIADGKSTKTLTIRHNYAFDDGHQSIKAFAYHKDGTTITFAGQVNVVKCNPKIVNICFVNVNIQRNRSISSGIPSNDFLINQQDNLKRFFSQAHIIPQIMSKSLNLENDSIAEHLTVRTISNQGRNYRINAVLKYTIDENKEYIGTKLERWFNESYPSLANAYKVFFIGEYGLRVTNGRDYYLGGHANGIPSKGLVVYKDPGDSVVCHEILHCFGLWHSFSNKSKHTFVKRKTNNIMDYSKDTISLWRWQWNVIRNASDVISI